MVQLLGALLYTSTSPENYGSSCIWRDKLSLHSVPEYFIQEIHIHMGIAADIEIYTLVTVSAKNYLPVSTYFLL